MVDLDTGFFQRLKLIVERSEVLGHTNINTSRLVRQIEELDFSWATLGLFTNFPYLSFDLWTSL